MIARYSFAAFICLAQLKGLEVRLISIIAGHLGNFRFIVPLSIVPNLQLNASLFQSVSKDFDKKRLGLKTPLESGQSHLYDLIISLTFQALLRILPYKVHYE